MDATCREDAAMSVRDWEAINALALWIHAEHGLRMLQAGALQRIERLVPCTASMFDLSARENEDGARPEFGAAIARGMDKAQLERYYAEFANRDYTTWCFETDQPTVYRDLDLVSTGARDRSAIYREWMEPQGLYFGCGAVLVAEKRLVGSVTLFRTRDMGEFSDLELRRLLEVARHLSLRLNDLLGGGDPAADAVRKMASETHLTPREHEVLELMLAGATNPEMARKLHISESTLKKHVNALYRKLGIRGRAGLAGRILP